MNQLAEVTVARGDSRLDEEQGALLKSPLAAASDEQWTKFVRAMVVATVNAVSASNALGMFEMTPRRLADLGMVGKLERRQSAGRTIWVAVFVPPMSSDKFLSSPQLQYRALCRSMRDYAKKIESGEIEKKPQMSMSGALAILHRAGPQGLKSWERGDRFPSTEEAFHKVSGVF